ncbi:MAG: AarF/UbiB family protein, partial [Phycisphaerae bacterium]
MLTILDQFLDWLPEGYVGYRPVLADALHYYWQQLSETQQQSMLAHQSALPRSARLEVRLLTFLLESPILHKLGQVLARHEDLDPELRRFLQRLEVLSTNRSHQEITELVQKAMGSRHQTVLRSIGQPLAEASVAVVVPVVCETPTVPFRDGVLKLRKPGVQERFEQEIPIWEELGDILTESCRSRGLPAMDYRGVVDRVMTLLRGDLDFMQEYRHLRLATKVFAGDRSVRVPEVSDRFLPDALLMERLPGETLNACLSSDST